MPLDPRLRIEGREHQVLLGLAGVGDPDLGARQAVARRRAGRADPLRSEPEGARVGAGLRFGEGECTQPVTGDHRCQPTALLLARAPGDHRQLRQDVHRQGDRERHVGIGDLFHDQGPRAVAEPGATKVFGDRKCREAELAQPREQAPVVAFLVVAFGGSRRHLLRRELACRPLEQPFLVGQVRRRRTRGHRCHQSKGTTRPAVGGPVGGVATRTRRGWTIRLRSKPSHEEQNVLNWQGA